MMACETGVSQIIKITGAMLAMVVLAISLHSFFTRARFTVKTIIVNRHLSTTGSLLYAMVRPIFVFTDEAAYMSCFCGAGNTLS